MNGKIRFIHTADIHLGSILNIGGNPDDDIQQIISTAVELSFDRICRAAVLHQVDFIIISGDLYDGYARSVRAANFLKKQWELLDSKGIKVFWGAGNHDADLVGRDIMKFPANFHTFPSENPQTYYITNRDNTMKARIIGQSYRGRADSRRMYLDYDAPGDGLFNIAVLHTQLEGENLSYVPCSTGELMKKGNIHYWALGHIHKRRLVNEYNPTIVWPGIPQGRDMGEGDMGGCILVEVGDDLKPAISFIPTSCVTWHRIDLVLEEADDLCPRNLTELEEYIVEKSGEMTATVPRGLRDMSLVEESQHREYLKGYIVEWVIRGGSILENIFRDQQDEYEHILVENLRARLSIYNPFIWTRSISIKRNITLTQEEIEENPLLQDIDMIAKTYVSNPDKKGELLRELGQIWKVQADHEAYDPFSFNLDSNNMEYIIEEAKLLLMEKLIKGRIR